ncbi:MAG: type III-B CRISPR module-associated Cmr3 family protein [Pseudomonadota bacterium]
MTTLFLEPLDVLYLRGNQHFGAAGSHGAALMPPWPSLAAGAIRSRLLASGETLDTLAGFRLAYFGLARRNDAGQAQPFLPLPADVQITSPSLDDACYAVPQALTFAVSSTKLPRQPVFVQTKPAKPESGLWLDVEGIAAWMNGEPIKPPHVIRSSQLWQSDLRLGIALDPARRTAAESRIYTAEAVALAQNIGFVASYGGAPVLTEDALVRLGGDGRGAIVHRAFLDFPEPDWGRIEREGRFRLMLLTPTPFADGWRPTGIAGELVAASVPRATTISGWDLAANDKGGAPKRAWRAAPAGSVYWFDRFSGDIAALKTLASDGLPLPDPTRQAEGFGKLVIAPWAC